MFTMVLADDEYLVREGLRTIIDWEQYGIKIIAEAANGREAVDLCLHHEPDILFTDIRMPFMDGLEAATILKERGKEVKIIIFSGIQDFGYAKSALGINAEGYILKPLDVTELINVVMKVVTKITNERNLAQKINTLREQLNEHFNAAREQFLRYLILGAFKKEVEILEKLEYFKHPFQADQSFVVAVLQIDDYDKTTANYLEEEKQLLSFSIAKVVEELVHSYTQGICIQMADHNYAMILNIKTGVSLEEENDIYSEIVKYVSNYLQISVSLGVGPKVEQVLQINSAYKDALNALDFKFYTGKGTIIHSSDIGISDINFKQENLSDSDYYEKQNHLVSLIKLGNETETEQAVRDLFESFRQDQKFTIEYVQRICAEYVFFVSRTFYEIGADFGDITTKRPAVLDAIYHTESIFELEQQMRELLITMAAYFARKYAQKNTKVIMDIKKLIDEQYMEDISINTIAETVYLSPNYISSLFRRETGETITDYLTRKRMEVAKGLLKNTDYKILDVANQVGFQDPSYFSKVFKKYSGVHPQQYRTIGT
jgi:two-component system, response regulator YesN